MHLALKVDFSIVNYTLVLTYLDIYSPSELDKETRLHLTGKEVPNEETERLILANFWSN